MVPPIGFHFLEEFHELIRHHRARRNELIFPFGRGQDTRPESFVHVTPRRVPPIGFIRFGIPLLGFIRFAFRLFELPLKLPHLLIGR